MSVGKIMIKKLREKYMIYKTKHFTIFLFQDYGLGIYWDHFGYITIYLGFIEISWFYRDKTPK